MNQIIQDNIRNKNVEYQVTKQGLLKFMQKDMKKHLAYFDTYNVYDEIYYLLTKCTYLMTWK